MFTVLHDDNGVFKDYSFEASDFSRDDFVLDLSSTEDYLYVGYKKPWHFFYVEMTDLNDISTYLTAEYYNGSAWTSVSGLRDESLSFQRSGFVSHDKKEDWELSSVNSVELYWIRYRPALDINVLTKLRGIGIVFSDDNDLREDIAEIDKKLPRDASSFILKHVSARKEMLQELRNRGYKKSKDNNLIHITEFDFFYPDKELRQASKYLALQKIFFNIHDEIEDVNAGKALEFQKKHDRLFNTFFLSLDLDDDGEIDIDEQLQIDSIEIVRD